MIIGIFRGGLLLIHVLQTYKLIKKRKKERHFNYPPPRKIFYYVSILLIIYWHPGTICEQELSLLQYLICTNTHHRISSRYSDNWMRVLSSKWTFICLSLCISFIGAMERPHIYNPKNPKIKYIPGSDSLTLLLIVYNYHHW